MNKFTILAGLATVAVAGSTSLGAFVETFEGLPTGGVSEGTTFLSGMTGEFVATSSGDNDGLALFDSNGPTTGPASQDPDLIVGSGNILILQDSNANAGPNDANEGGEIYFDFTAMGGEDLSAGYIDLVDFNGASASVFTLTDFNGNTRVFDIPNDWTGDPLEGFPGINRLFFDGGAQQGVGPGLPFATVSDDAGFDITAVTQIEFAFGGSGGLDNFAAIPMPAPLALAGAGLLGVAGYRRR